MEKKNVLSLHPEVAKRLRNELFSLLSASEGGGHSVFADPDRETEARLKALGYVGSWEEAGSQENWFVGPDPAGMMGPYQLFNTAKGLVHQGQWLQAVQMFRLAVQADPNNTDARMGLVHSLVKNSEYAAALREAHEAMALHPEKGEVRYTLGRLLLSQHRPGDALAAATKALIDGADPVSGHMLVGECAQTLGDHDKAIRSFQSVLNLDESYIPARFGLGRSFASIGKPIKAEQEFRSVLEQNPYWAPAQYNYGVFLMNRQEFQEAIPYFQKAIRISRTYAEPHHALAVVYYENGKIRKAQEHLEEALRYANEAETRAATLALREEIGRRL